VRSRGRLNLAMPAVVGVAVMSFLAGCQSTSASTAPAPTRSASASVSIAPVPPAEVTIAPADGATAVALGSHVSVSVANGTLTSVSVTDADGDAVDGTLDATAASWTTAADLFPATHYLVTATAVDASGKTTNESSSFTTAAAPHLLSLKIAPLEGETVGVGMPIVVYFSTAVTNKAAVEKALTVDMSEPVDGAWHWYGSKEAHFRPAQYWPAGEQVTLHADLRGVDAGKGVWGNENRTLNFSVGDSHIANVDAKLHTMTVYVNGKVARVAAVSTGRDKYPTTSGIHVVLEKSPSIIMDSATVGIPKGNPDYYYETVLWDVRISWSGEFVHSAPWSVASQGRANVSHGCVNADAADAEWFYNLSRRGDLVVVTGTPRPLAAGNGWTDWNLDWSQWLAGSAIYGTGNYTETSTNSSTYGATASAAATPKAKTTVKPSPSPSATPSPTVSVSSSPAGSPVPPASSPTP
jgi:lipoprotein-anchoring transpeptidase ErfK/SrfK